MLTDAAIIGGTGIGDLLAALPGQAIHIPTSFGQLAGRLVEHPSGPVLVVSRHSAGHKRPPHLVNYPALALGLRKVGVRHCFSTAAVGSLRREWGAGTLVAVSDFVDFTARNETLYSRTVVHTDFSEPFSHCGSSALVDAGEAAGVTVQPKGIYVGLNGPRYETPQEIRLLAGAGDLVGMTASTEAIVMREAGVAYSCLALVTNLAAGFEDRPLSHTEVVEEMTASAQTVLNILFGAVDLVRRS
jgi:5'-methylthioadenosine phosphorylase